MPRDVLGLDPYQASAVSCAKRGAILAGLLTLGAIGLAWYGLNGGTWGFAFQSSVYWH